MKVKELIVIFLTTVAMVFIGCADNGGGGDIGGDGGGDTLTTPTPIAGFEWINPGTFTMGSSSDSDPDHYGDEVQHEVTLTKGFYMAKYAVTQEQYQSVMGSNPSYFNNNPASEEEQGKRPVERVRWYDTIVFCNKLSITEWLTPVYTIDGKTNPDDWEAIPVSDYATWDAVEMSSTANGYRLPTEAEWEYACRAGTQTVFNNGNNNYTNVGAIAWHYSNSDNKTHEIGKKIPNAWGLYDMHGNVYEWCWDWYDDYDGAATDPKGPRTPNMSYGAERVSRGGCFDHLADNARSAYRYFYGPWGGLNVIGFRLVRQQ
ncbi:MAG: formylglycine-generating enzyme family protein [Spirochaetaceae bacterium]|nr:formylglycine-generating enzyme family protein [Spirochaetaceae bacterium]